MEDNLTLYEFNKATYLKAPAYTQEQIIESKSIVKSFLEANPFATYFMCLNHELRYYTLYHKVSTDYGKLAYEILDIMSDMGEIVSIELDVENNMIEFWIRNGEEIHMFPLFDYTLGVVEV